MAMTHHKSHMHTQQTHTHLLLLLHRRPLLIKIGRSDVLLRSRGQVRRVRFVPIGRGGRGSADGFSVGHGRGELVRVSLSFRQ